MNVKLISITPNSEKIISYCARVSNEKNQENYATMDKLLKYCIDHHHWSIFEMANMCLEITTSRVVETQLLRHKSFSFQSFSLRYSEAMTYENYQARRQDVKNRQNSINDLSNEIKDWFEMAQKNIWEKSYELYKEALKRNISKESSRFFLPLNTQTKLYMNGNIRSWITYIQVRTDLSTQKEHRDIAETAKQIFIKELPIISKALGWV